MVFTGANRSLGTTTAPALSKHSMAEPMAVSSWKTAGVEESRGLMVFLFLIRGSLSTPPLLPSVLLRHSCQIRQIVLFVSDQPQLAL